MTPASGRGTLLLKRGRVAFNILYAARRASRALSRGDIRMLAVQGYGVTLVGLSGVREAEVIVTARMYRIVKGTSDRIYGSEHEEFSTLVYNLLAPTTRSWWRRHSPLAKP